jgi:broad specificity phosphatase PhoE
MGDSSIGKGEKMKQVIQEYSDKHKDGNILLVTHGGSIGDLLRLLFGEKDTPHVIDPVTGAPHIQIGECSITVIKKNGDTYELLKINDTSHLSTPLF